MATIGRVLQGLRGNLVPLFNNFQVKGQTIKFEIGEDWPDQTLLQEVSRIGCVMAIVCPQLYLPAGGVWPRKVLDVMNPIGIKSVLSTPLSAPGQVQTLTLSIASGQTAVYENDAVSFVVDAISRKAVVVSAGVGETLASMAIKLAAAINATAVLSDWVHATANNGVVSVENISSYVLSAFSACGNVGTRYFQTGTAHASLQVVPFCKSANVRRAVNDVLEETFSAWASKYGFQIEGPENVRVTELGRGTNPNRDEHLPSDVYRSDWILQVEYTVTRAEMLYSVLAPVQNQRLF